MYLRIVFWPRATATCAQAVLTDLAIAVTRSTWPKLSLKSLVSGTPEIGRLFVPSTAESTRYFPESIAAVAVTTFIVEPGASPNCSARLTSGLRASSRFSRPSVLASRTAPGS